MGGVRWLPTSRVLLKCWLIYDRKVSAVRLHITLLLLENPPDLFIQFRASSLNIVTIVSQRGKKAALLFLLNVAGTAKKRWLITTNCCKWLTISVQTHVWSLLGPEINSKSYRNTSPQSSRDMAKAPVKKSFQLVVSSTLMNTLTKLQLTASRALISLILFIARSRDWTASTVKPGSALMCFPFPSPTKLFKYSIQNIVFKVRGRLPLLERERKYKGIFFA